MVDATIAAKVNTRKRQFIVEAGLYHWYIPKPNNIGDEYVYTVHEIHSYYGNGDVCSMTARIKINKIPKIAAITGTKLVEMLTKQANISQ